MATRAATFSAKIRTLKDYQYRIVNNITPLPAGIDIANTLKYFAQTLTSVLREVPKIPRENFGPSQKDSVRLAVFPSLNYTGVFQAAISLIDIVPQVQQGQLVLGECILSVLACIVPFLEYDLLESLPYTVASSLAIFPVELHREIVSFLCANLLPLILGVMGSNPTVPPNATSSYALNSTAAIMLMVFQYTPNPEFHSQLIETVMAIKRTALRDLMSVVAYGTAEARAPAANLIFHYWPELNLTLSNRRDIHYMYQGRNDLHKPSIYGGNDSFV